MMKESESKMDQDEIIHEDSDREENSEQKEVNQKEESLRAGEKAPQEPSYRLAGFWMRMWAFLADLLVVFSINGLLLSPLRYFGEGGDIILSVWSLKGILSSIVFYLYFLIMTKMTGQTLGKMIFGLKVIRDDQKPLQWLDLFFREVVIRFVYKAYLFLNLLYLIVAFNKEKRGLHDMIGQTKVIHVE